MKTEMFGFKLKGTKMFIPETEKGERNPYVSDEESSNPFMKEKTINIKDEHIENILDLLEKLGYNTSEMKKD